MDREMEKAMVKAAREYVEAFDRYGKWVDMYCRVVIPGERSEADEAATLEAVRQLEVAQADVDKKLKRWRELLGGWFKRSTSEILSLECPLVVRYYGKCIPANVH